MRGKSSLGHNDGRKQTGVTRTGIKPLKSEVFKHQVFIKKVGGVGKQREGRKEGGREEGLFVDNNAIGEHLKELCVLLFFSPSQFFCAFLVCLAVICDF